MTLSKKWKIFRKLRKSKLGDDVNKRFLVSAFSPSAIAALPASTMLRFGVILAQVNLFYTVTPV